MSFTASKPAKAGEPKAQAKPKTQARPGGIRRLLWPHLKPQLGALTLALLLGLLIAALSAAQPLLTRVVIDQGLIGRQFPRLGGACLGMLALALAGFALGGVHRVVYVRASGRALFSLRGAVYAHLLGVSPRRLARVPVGDLVSRLDGDIAEVQRFGTDAAAAFISSVLTLVTVGAVMLGLSWRLTLLVVALLPLQLAVRHYARPRIEASTRALRESAAQLSGFLVETLSAARSVQAAAAEALEARRLNALGDAYLGRVLRQQWVSYATGSFAGFLGHIATAGTFVLGGWYVLEGRLSVGTLVAFVAYLGRSSGSAASIASLYTGYHRARVSLVRVEELLDIPAVVERPDAKPLPADARGALRLEAVCVGTESDQRAVLDGVSVDIPAGSKVVLRGASGAGKSTLADLLRRFLDPDAGRILLDGRPLESYQLADLRRRIVVVDHSPVLFRGSILDNLRYGHPWIDEATAIAAAGRAGVTEFVERLPQGFATQVGEAGAGLSTGQRQRIAIARASLAEPLIVILDEATSGLDVESARAVHRSLDATFPQRTRVVITHRAGDVEGSDFAGVSRRADCALRCWWVEPMGWRVGLIDSCGRWPGASRAAAFVAAGNQVECREPAADPTGHGSRIAGLLGRDRRIELLLGQVFTAAAASTGAAVAAAVDWAAAGGADLIHLSLGLAADRPLLGAAVARAIDAGCIVVASTPARGAPVYPAAYPGVIRATGDARCAPGEISCLAPGLFGGCPRLEDVPADARAGAAGGASIGAAWVTWSILGGHAPLAASGVIAGLTAAARYVGPERRSTISSGSFIESR